MTTGVHGLCTHGVKGFSGIRMAREFRTGAMGRIGRAESERSEDGDGLMCRSACVAGGASVRARKALRLRCQILVLTAVALWVALSNAIVLLWWLAGRKPACRWSLHQGQGAGDSCVATDPEAVAALTVGAFLLWETLADIWRHARAPLVLLDGEVEC